MAIGDVTLKKIFQGALSTAVTARYTCPASKQAQITDIWLDNQNTTTTRYVSLYAHGTAATNRLVGKIQIRPGYSVNISQGRIVLDAGQVLALAQDVGTDVVATIYGTEEVVI
ncbi:hypothetical protein [Acetobacterium malicum]|uniref:hypothetical protein n=1 Tax=Acetobacterium malicum TaxID=52692 RepID=UPI00047BADEE|nr:hypothetical protein [Acetobacterium dehalogenans]